MPIQSPVPKGQTYLRNISGKVTAGDPEVVTIAAGAAGSYVDFVITQHPIANNKGDDIGGGSDSSLAISAGTVFTTQVGYKDDADLANGEYYVNHLTGKGRGRKADTSTSITFTLNVFALITTGGSTANTELPAADADGDSDADIDTPDVAARMKGWNGSAWSKIRAGITTVSSTFTGFLNSLLWGIYNSSPTTRTDGQGGPLQTDSKGNLLVSLNTLISGENQSASRMMMSRPGNWNRISSAATTVLTTGTGIFLGVYVEDTLTGTVDVYDNTSGSGTKLLTLKVGTTQGFHGIPSGGGRHTTGLTVVTSAADKIVVGSEPN